MARKIDISFILKLLTLCIIEISVFSYLNLRGGSNLQKVNLLTGPYHHPSDHEPEPISTKLSTSSIGEFEDEQLGNLKICLFFIFQLKYLVTFDTFGLDSVFLPKIPKTEFEALKQFYDSTNGKYWDYIKMNNTRWNFTDYNFNNPCSGILLNIFMTH
jgi:hypothetical protein